MIFTKIIFEDRNAARIYASYLTRVRHAIKGLNKANQDETMMEINSHIYEAMAHSGKSEVESILDVTDKLGDPALFLKELVAERSLEEATKSFNPVRIFKALLLNMTNGIFYIVFFILYLSLFSFVFLVFAKIFDPEHVGLFYKKDSFFILGAAGGTGSDYIQYEYLGHWFIPVMLVSAALLYTIITLLLKLKKTAKRVKYKVDKY